MATCLSCSYVAVDVVAVFVSVVGALAYSYICQILHHVKWALLMAQGKLKPNAGYSRFFGAWTYSFDPLGIDFADFVDIGSKLSVASVVDEQNYTVVVVDVELDLTTCLYYLNLQMKMNLAFVCLDYPVGVWIFVVCFLALRTSAVGNCLF